MKSECVASTKDILPGKGIKIKLGGTHIAIFNHNGYFYAIQNRCPHQSADLADGYIRNNQLYCPMHNWAFDIETGAFAFNPEQKLKIYPVEVHNDNIFIIYD
jgi:NAD(P)H-dependent nitrite reductase small subunit